MCSFGTVAMANRPSEPCPMDETEPVTRSVRLESAWQAREAQRKRKEEKNKIKRARLPHCSKQHAAGDASESDSGPDDEQPAKHVTVTNSHLPATLSNALLQISELKAQNNQLIQMNAQLSWYKGAYTELLRTILSCGYKTVPAFLASLPSKALKALGSAKKSW